MKSFKKSSVGVLALTLSACATMPRGPIYTQYAPGSPERYCAELAYKESATGGMGENAAQGMALGAIGGAALGAITGALLGNPGIGAAAGAGMGLGAGAGAGVSRTDKANSDRLVLFNSCMSLRWHEKR